jgi:FKBP-type peptidyl-prolyl cis-trans isomerase 2
MKVSAGHFVRIDCELRVTGGDVIESSKKTGPVEYKHGFGQLLKGLEAKLEGMGIGDEKDGVILAADAFGTEDAQPPMTIPRASFPADAKIEVGAKFEAKGPRGTQVSLEVLALDDETITAKVVHPLAGKDLEFKVKVLAVRPPAPPVPKSPAVEELELVEEPET